MYFIIFLTITLFIWYVSRTTFERPVEDDGKSILKLHGIFGFVGIACMVVGLVLPVHTLLTMPDEPTAEIITILIAMFIFFGALGYWMFLWSRNHEVVFDDQNITVSNTFRKQKTFRWADVKHVWHDGMSGKYVITLATNEKIGVHQYLSGVKEFIAKVEHEIRQTA